MKIWGKKRIGKWLTRNVIDENQLVIVAKTEKEFPENQKEE